MMFRIFCKIFREKVSLKKQDNNSIASLNPIFHYLHGILFKIHSNNPALRKRFKRIHSSQESFAEKNSILVEGALFDKPSLELQNEAYKIKTNGEFLMLYEGLRVYRLGEKTLYEDDDSYLLSNRENQTFAGFIAEPTLKKPLFFESIFWPFFVWEILSFEGLFLLHAAALKDPYDRGFLFAGNGQQGKTTLSLSLIRHGYSFVSDDMIFFQKEGRILPYPLDFHIDPFLAEHFEELAFLRELPPHYTLNPKRRVPKARLLSLYESRGSQSLSHLEKVDFIFFPSIHSLSKSRIETLGKSQALANLIPTSVLVLFSQEKAMEHMTSLKNLVEHANCFRILLGNDLWQNPSQIPLFIANNLSQIHSPSGENNVFISRR